MSSRKLIPTQSWKLIEFSQSQNYANWGPPLTLAQYQERERIGYLHKLCNLQRDWKVDNKGVVYWVMSDDAITASEANDTNDDDELKKLVCASETLIREAWVLNPNSDGIENCQAGVIGSVYTFTKHRSKGYASSMLFDIPVQLKENKLLFQNDNDFLYLYSEVGEDFYRKFGYVPIHVPVVKIPIVNDEQNKLVNLETEGFVKLTNGDAELLSQCIEIYKDKLHAQMSTVSSDNKKRKFCIVPNVEGIEWFQNRSIHTGNTLYGSVPNTFGLKIDQSLIIWFYDYSAKSAFVLMINADSLETLKKLINGLMLEVRAVQNNYSIEYVKCWQNELIDYANSGDYCSNDSNDVIDYVQKELNAEVGLVNDSISAVRIGDNGGDENVEWVGNGKWAWY